MIFALFSFCTLVRTTLAQSVETGGGYYCDDSFNFVNGAGYSQISLTSSCPCCNCNPVYDAPNDVSKAVAWCKEKCDEQSTCTGFFFQRHGNGHEICGFYTGLDPLRSSQKSNHGHQIGSQLCAKREKAQEIIPNHAMVTAFEYTFDEVGQACEEFGALGYTAVHISPPQDNNCMASWEGGQADAYNDLTMSIGNKPANWYNSWHCKYQPRSYNISACWSHGKCGSELEFYEMAKKCRLHNVHVLVDLVMNHMMVGFRQSELKPTADYSWPVPGADSQPGPRTFAAPQDFHSCYTHPNQWKNQWDVKHCDLYDLADLDTSSDTVRQEQVKYVNRLIALGASAFRIDASGCMYAEDTAYLAEHITDVRSDFGGGRPFIFQEVPVGKRKLDKVGDNTQGDTTKHEYYNFGMQVTEHEPEHWIVDMLDGHGTLGALFEYMKHPQSYGLVEHGKALTFIDNHDSQRYSNVLSHKTPETYELAQMWLLAFPYGTVKVMSSYQFSGAFDPRPQVSPQGNCPWDGSPEWKCEYGWRGIKNAVGLRNECARVGAWHPVNRHESNDGQCIVFSRLSPDQQGAFFAVNFHTSECHIPHNIQTGLKQGVYPDLTVCDSVTCHQNVHIGSDGIMMHNWVLAPKKALMFHTGVMS